MPHFLAPLSQHSALIGDVFLLDVEILPLGPSPLYGAAVCENIHRSYISEPLARRCGFTGMSVQTRIRIKAWSPLTLRLHEFDSIPLKFHLANKELGPNYVGLGIEDLEQFFDLERRDPASTSNPSPPFIFMEPLAHVRHLCRQH